MLSNLKQKNILITGGLGFIGSNIAIKLVKSGTKVTIFDAKLDPYGWNEYNIHEIKNDVELVIGDIRNKSALSRVVINKDCIFHLAGQVSRFISMDNPFLDNEINSIGTLNLLETVRESKSFPKIVFSSSRGVMGEVVRGKVDEKAYPRHTDIYGADKLVCEKYLEVFHRTYGFNTVSLRLNNVYGPKCQLKSPHYGIVNLFIGYILKNKTIPIYGTGRQTRDYIYIEDVVNAFLKAAINEKVAGETFFVGSGENIEFLEMVKKLINIAGVGNYKFVDYPEIVSKIDVRGFNCDIGKAKLVLGWEPETTLDSGLLKTIEYYRENLDHYV